MYVVEYEAKVDAAEALPDAPAHSLACVNTHDMAPFAAWFSGSDTAERLELGLIDEETSRAESHLRDELRGALLAFLKANGCVGDTTDAKAVLRTILARLRDGPARFLLVNLEDLWLETRPQNVPSTTDESPNWRRKARHALEEFENLPQVLEALRHVERGFRCS
jgi:4-alpha-glucanotransferase